MKSAPFLIALLIVLSCLNSPVSAQYAPCEQLYTADFADSSVAVRIGTDDIIYALKEAKAADPNYQSVEKYDLLGNPIETLSLFRLGVAYDAMALSPTNEIIVSAETGEVRRFNPDGSFVNLWSTGRDDTRVYDADDNYVYVGGAEQYPIWDDNYQQWVYLDSHNLFMYTASGFEMGNLTPDYEACDPGAYGMDTTCSHVTDARVGPDGLIYVTKVFPEYPGPSVVEIHIYDQATEVDSWVAGPCYPYDMGNPDCFASTGKKFDIDDHGNIHIPKDAYDHSMNVYDPYGTVIRTYTYGGTGSAEDWPQDIAVAGGGETSVVLVSTNYYSGALYKQDIASEASTPASPLQSCYDEPVSYWQEHVIELRTDYLPQAVTLGLDYSGECLCGGDVPTSATLKPRSNTGRHFNVVGNSVYFLMDNLTSMGYYDLFVTCPNGVEVQSPVHVNYIGYTGYAPSGVLYNSLTGGAIRGALVNLWEWTGVGDAYELVQSTVASDATYFFEADPGTYKVQVLYELSGEQWRGPFDVVAKATGIPYEDMDLVPVTSDSAPPDTTGFTVSSDSLTLSVVDPGVGLAVVEVVPGTLDNIHVNIPTFELGEAQVDVVAYALNPASAASCSLRCLDQLGNRTMLKLDTDALTAVDPTRPPALLSAVGNDPNPFNPSTKIFYTLSAPAVVSLKIYDIRGRQVDVICDSQPQDAGRHEIVWHGLDDRGQSVASGSYFLQVQADDESVIKTLSLVR